MPLTPSHPIHCFHESRRDTFGDDRTDTEICCGCPATRATDFALRADPAHGPRAPKAWTKVRERLDDRAEGR